MKAFSKILIAGCVAAASFAPAAQAEKFFGSSSISILHSDQYQGVQFDAGGNGGFEYEATYFTFENATAHNWGSTFFFIDREMTLANSLSGYSDEGILSILDSMLVEDAMNEETDK